MMMKVIISQIDSFTKQRFKGNPVGVVINADGLNDNQMQQIAGELSNSETAFLFSPDDNDCDCVLRYFRPKTEVPTCGHATIAEMYAKAIEENIDYRDLKIKTQIGILPFEIIRSNCDYQVIITQGKFEISLSLNDITHTSNLLRACSWFFR
jgi:PhzF family phenazine biosynthesis protein